MIRALRVAGAAGFWGDRNDALLDQVCGGWVDVVVLDYLSEVTTAILRGRQMRDPNAGWATDFLTALRPALQNVVKRGIKLVTNAGGTNPVGCAEAVLAAARDRGVRGLRVAVVLGDDLFGRIDELAAAGIGLEHATTGTPLSTVRERLLAANVHLGAEPIAEALDQGAQIVIAGRTADAALTLGPLVWHFGWASNDWERRAAGIVAGHVLESGGHAAVGHFAGLPDVPDLARLGYPIAEVGEDGELVVTKHRGLGGRVTTATVTEQLLHELGDPTAYATPDATVDFSDVELEDLGDDRVAVRGAHGAPPPTSLLTGLAYQDGWRNVATITFVWPYALERARLAEALLLERFRHLGIRIDAHHVDLVGVAGAHGPMAPPLTVQPNEVLFRMAVRTSDRDSARRFGAELGPLLSAGIPGVCRGPSAVRPAPTPIIQYWPARVPLDAVAPRIELMVS